MQQQRATECALARLPFRPPLFAALRRFSAAEQIEGKSAAPRVHAICTPPTRPAFTGAFSRLGTSGTSTLPPPPPPPAAAGVTHTYGSLLQRLQAGLSSHCFFFFLSSWVFFLFIYSSRLGGDVASASQIRRLFPSLQTRALGGCPIS